MNTLKSFRLIKNSLTTLLIAFSGYVLAQNSRMVFGEINKEEINYTKCDFDPDADAVVFFDSGDTKFEDNESGFDVIYTRYTRIKILKTSGTHWAEVKIPLYVSNNIYENIENLQAVAYNVNEYGVIEKSPISLKECLTEKINNNWVQRKFAIPNVKAGTIIEYKYQVSSQYVFNLHDWEFQWKIPVIYSEYNVSLIPFFQYTYLLQGATQFDSYETSESEYERMFGSVKFKDLRHHFVLVNLPAFNDEEFISSMNDYIIKLEFQLSRINYPDGRKKDILSTWPTVKDELMGESTFGGFQKKCQKMANKILDVKTLLSKSPGERFDSVITSVKKNFSWDNNYRLYSTKTPARLLEDKSGSSSDLNLLTCGLLNAVGVSARPVIISTRGHGKIRTGYPFLNYFNNVVICVNLDSSNVVTDATNTEIDNYRLPLGSINGIGLIVDKQKKVEWCNLNSRYPSIEKTKIQLTINQDKTTAQINVNANEYLNQNYRNRYNNTTSILKDLYAKNYELNDSDIHITPFKNPCEFQFQYKCQIKSERMNNKLYISPFCHELFTINPLKQKSRSYPIDMIYTQEHNYESEFELPTGYQVNYIPANKEIDNEQFKLSFSCTQNGNKLKAILVYRFKKPEYESSQFENLKNYFKEIISSGSEKVVIEKTLTGEKPNTVNKLIAVPAIEIKTLHNIRSIN